MKVGGVYFLTLFWKPILKEAKRGSIQYYNFLDSLIFFKIVAIMKEISPTQIEKL